MSVIGAREVEQAHATGAVCRVGPGDLLTPLARERAADLGVRVEIGAEPPPQHPTPQHPTSQHSTSQHPPSQRPAVAQPTPAPAPGPAAAGRPPNTPATVNGLYRRGAPLTGALRPVEAGTDRPRIAVIGAGHVGSVTALRLAETDLFAEVVLVDVVDGLAAGIALDLWHSAALARFATLIRGTTDLADIAGVDYVIMTAGRARKPGMTRLDLTAANATVVGPVADRIAELAPSSVVVMVTNPLEEMTQLARVRTGFPAGRVLGMAGVLDSARFRALVALTGICRPEAVRAYALGSHGPEMVIPLSLATIGERPIRELLAPPVLADIVNRTRDSGAEVVSLLKSGSAYFAPGQSAATMAVSMVRGTGELLACAVEPTGEYGLRDTRVGLPVRLGPGGLVEIVELPLEPAEWEDLRAAADRLGERVREVTADASGGVLSAR
jgi:malate dehydrogenase